jgi:DNA-binding phage protein
MGIEKSAFWDDLAEDLKDPHFLRQYVAESVRIAAVDEVINALDETRAEVGLTKAALARAINAEPSVLRRLLAAGQKNPTLGTVAEVAAVLGLRVTLTPMSAEERELVMSPLRTGRCEDAAAVADHSASLRRRSETLAS